MFGDLRASALPISVSLLPSAPEGSEEFHGQPASHEFKAFPTVVFIVQFIKLEVCRGLFVRFGLAKLSAPGWPKEKFLAGNAFRLGMLNMTGSD